MTKGRIILCLLKTRSCQRSLTTSIHIATIVALKGKSLTKGLFTKRAIQIGKLMKSIGVGFEQKLTVLTKGNN